MLNRNLIIIISAITWLSTPVLAQGAANSNSVKSGSMTSASTTVLAASAAASSTPAGSTAGVLAFQAWKQSQIDDAKTHVEKAQASLLVQPKSSGAPDTSARIRSGRAEQIVRQAQLNVEIAQELTVNDYFVLYLNQFKTKDAFLDVAKKLTPDETADLLVAYQKSLASSGSERDQMEAPSNGLITSTPPTLAFGKKR
jgi:hypothetical protein